MKLTNTELQNFIGRIKLKRDNMPRYRDQVSNLINKLEKKIAEDDGSGLKVTKVIRSGSWKKGTILRSTGDNPIDVDLVFYVEGDDNILKDVESLHDAVVEYLGDIYPQKDISKDVNAEGKTKSIKIQFSGTGLEIDIVPVIPLKDMDGYVWQPERGGGGKYITSVSGQLKFAKDAKDDNPSYTSIVRAIKWWRNYKELKGNSSKETLSSYTIELIVAYLDLNRGVEKNIENGIIRFFEFLSSDEFPLIYFEGAMNDAPNSADPAFVGDPTNNDNNTIKKMTNPFWKEVKKEANEAFETLCIAQARVGSGDTISEWKNVFGHHFNINQEN
tara:strand:- start:7083 stop:8072 length:990 start_codon:yes stop_codon:yes gene_type:complete